MTYNSFVPNKFAAACHVCGATVDPGKGYMMATDAGQISHKRDRDPNWVVQHRKGKHTKQFHPDDKRQTT